VESAKSTGGGAMKKKKNQYTIKVPASGDYPGKWGVLREEHVGVEYSETPKGKYSKKKKRLVQLVGPNKVDL